MCLWAVARAYDPNMVLGVDARPWPGDASAEGASANLRWRCTRGRYARLRRGPRSEDGGAACSCSCGEYPRTEARDARSASESWVHQQGVKLMWCDACLMQYACCCATWCAPRIGCREREAEGGSLDEGPAWQRWGRLGGMILRMGGGQSDRRCGDATRADLGAKMDHDSWGAEANLSGERDQAGRGRARARSRSRGP